MSFLFKMLCSELIWLSVLSVIIDKNRFYIIININIEMSILIIENQNRLFEIYEKILHLSLGHTKYFNPGDKLQIILTYIKCYIILRIKC